MNAFERIALYLRAAAATRSANVRGLPVLPKGAFPSAPYNRGWFNQFVLWLVELQLTGVRQVVDVGANHGDFSQAASAVFPDADVLLVEPLPTLHAELERRCAERSGRWKLAKCALGDTPGTATLHADAVQSDIASLLGFSEEYLLANPTAKPAETYSCEVQTLDLLCASRNIGSIDLLKVDVEGFEFEVFAGAQQMLARTRSVVVELSIVRRSGQSDAVERMLHLLRDAGFSLVELVPSLYSREQPWMPVEWNLLARKAD
jgi:FkbM family methyltransferase